MILNDETEALERVNSDDNLIKKLELRKLSNGGRRGFSPMIQTLAVACAEVTTQADAAQEFGMTQQNVSHLKNKGQSVDRSIVEHTVNDAHSKALDSMLECMNLIKPKLADVKKATDLSKIAADMARVVEKTSPKEGNNTLKIVVMAPVMRTEKDYEEAIA